MKSFSNICKIKHFLLLLVGVFVLFGINHNTYKICQTNRINDITEVNLIDKRRVKPEELFLNSWNIIKNNYYNNDLNKQNWTRWKKRYAHQIKSEEDAAVAINSMLASLDDSYSKFMTKEEFSLQNSAINSKLYGIGINIASISGKIYIINVLENAPAYNSGIRAGDILIKVDDEDVNGESVYHVARLIRGNLNESISLEVLRGTEKFTKTVKREEIKIKTIEAKKLDDIGYIRISSFIGADTAKEFIIALNRLKDSKALILDLRGNSGGLFQNAIAISSLFMKNGTTIVNVIARQGKKNVYNVENDGFIYSSPLVVLIDENSASASEILSSALHDNSRATLVGTRTYGKGLVQKVFSLPNQAGMNLTIAKYITPKGIDINKKGIAPDYTVKFSHMDFINNVDPQLIFAKQYLEKELSGKL